MNEIIPTSYHHLTDLLFADSWNQDIGRYRSPYAFRGMRRSDSSLWTSLRRLGGPYAELERHLLRNFRKYAHRETAPGNSFWQWLTLAQHHGLPTRLLDWTYSPWVALHFVTAQLDSFDYDGVVWMVDYHATSRRLPRRLALRLENEGSNVFTVEMLDELVANLAEFDRLDRKDFVLFLEPPSIDERIVSQFALFSILSNPATALDDWLTSQPELFRKIIVPAALKWEIRDKLDQGGITERLLYPGLDGLSAWLRRHYSPAHGAAAPERPPAANSRRSKGTDLP